MRVKRDSEVAPNAWPMCKSVWHDRCPNHLAACALLLRPACDACNKYPWAHMAIAQAAGTAQACVFAVCSVHQREKRSKAISCCRMSGAAVHNVEIFYTSVELTVPAPACPRNCPRKLPTCVSQSFESTAKGRCWQQPRAQATLRCRIVAI